MAMNGWLSIIKEKNPTYSPLALYFIIDNEIKSSNEEINEFFDIIINDVNLDKEMPDVVFTGEQYPIFTKYKSILEDSFGHLFRNSLDHGLETTDVRLELGKSKNGRIEINTKLMILN